MSIAGKTVLITGGTGGIGMDVARHFLEAGAKIVLADLNREKGEAVAESLGADASFIVLDVTREESWQDAMATLAGRELHALINAAGVFKPGIPFTEMSLDMWRFHFNVNLDGAFLGCKYGILAMKETGGGTIINLSSGLAHIMLTDGAAYCVSKAALLTLTKVAAKAGAKFKVRVNALLPGAIETDMMWGNLRPGLDKDTLIDMLLKQHPIGRLGQTPDVTRAIAFLCDPASDFITGALLAVDGGQLVV
jgi:NAD(P)-dependent dehydrogenase (short-subunit alcohol dehydrogenase family)